MAEEPAVGMVCVDALSLWRRAKFALRRATCREVAAQKHAKLARRSLRGELGRRSLRGELGRRSLQSELSQSGLKSVACCSALQKRVNTKMFEIVNAHFLLCFQATGRPTVCVVVSPWALALFLSLPIFVRCGAA